MRNHIFTRTTAAIIAIAMLMTLALLTTPGNNALGQSLPTVGFEDINVSVDEPDQSPYRVNAILTVQLSQASSQNVSVRYRTVDITAKAAERDYNATSGTLYFSPGTTERTISVTVLNDTVVEGPGEVQGGTVSAQRRRTQQQPGRRQTSTSRTSTSRPHTT